MFNCSYYITRLSGTIAVSLTYSTMTPLWRNSVTYNLTHIEHYSMTLDLTGNERALFRFEVANDGVVVV